MSMTAGDRVAPAEDLRFVSRILVAFEISAAAPRAFQRAMQIAATRRATVDVVGVAHPCRGLIGVACAAGSGYSPDQAEAEELAELDQRLRSLVAAAPPDIGITTRLEVGDPRYVVGELIESGRYDLLVMGAPSWFQHSRRLLARRAFREVDLLVVPAG